MQKVHPLSLLLPFSQITLCKCKGDLKLNFYVHMIVESCQLGETFKALKFYSTQHARLKILELLTVFLNSVSIGSGSIPNMAASVTVAVLFTLAHWVPRHQI